MKLGHDILYLSNEDIEACALGLEAVERAVEAALLAKAEGRASMKPKVAVHHPGQALFLAAPGSLETPAYGGMKWVAVADNHDKGLPHIAGLIILCDAETGMPVSVLDATWITAVRTPAISTIAARHLARPESRSIGFIACGLQARTHLAALRPHFPIERVQAYSRRLSTAESFAAELRDQGLDAEAFADPQTAIEGMDIVVTTTPVVPKTEAFLDAAWLAPGSFAAMVDLGFSWISESLPKNLDRVVTDDIAQAGTEGLAYKEPFDGEVAQLVSGAMSGRQNDQERTALVFAGLGLADVATAALVYERARETGRGRVLPL